MEHKFIAKKVSKSVIQKNNATAEKFSLCYALFGKLTGLMVGNIK